jgi:hypothetical protein
MPYFVCEVTSADIVVVGNYDDYSSDPYKTLEIRVEIEDARVRAWGRQLYALVGMFFLPVFVDALWFRGGGDVQWVERATDASRREEDCEAAAATSLTEDSQVVAMPDWNDGETPPRYGILWLATDEVREVFEERASEVCVALLALRERNAIRFLARLKTYGKARLALKDGSVVEILRNMVELAGDEPTGDELVDGTTSDDCTRKNNKGEVAGEIITGIICSPVLILAYVGYPIMIGMMNVTTFIIAMIESALTVARNLVFSLIPYALLRRWCTYFSNPNLSIQKSVKDDGKEVWELLTTLVYAGNSNQSNYFTCGLPPSIPVDVLRPGDTIKVGFGPFEYWCLFRN